MEYEPNENEPAAKGAGDMNSPKDELMLQEARKRWRICKNHWGAWREEARECYAFVAGKQWDIADIQKLKEERRVPVTFNRVEPMVDIVVGTEIGNRRQIRYIARSVEDSGVNDVYSAAADFYRDECEAEHEDTDAFRDCLICGIGATEVRLDFEEDPTGNIVIERVDPFEIWIDPDARKNNASDRRYMFRMRDVPYSEIKATWPEEAKDVYGLRQKSYWDTEIDDDAGDASGIHVTMPGDQYELDQGDGGSGFDDSAKLRLVEYQYAMRQPVFLVMNDQNMLQKMTQNDFAEWRVAMKAAGIPLNEGEDYFRAHQRVIKRAFIVGRKVMQHDVAPCVTHFSYPVITGKRDRNDRTWYGLVRNMIDPQRWANKFFSQILHIINTSAKSGAYVEEGAVDDMREFEHKFAKTGSLLWLRTGGLNKIKERGFGNYPAGIDKLMEFSIGAMREVTGINMELLGLADRQQAGVLEYQRKQAGLTILGFVFDNLRRYRKAQGEILLYFIENYVSDGRLIRITGPEGQKYVPLTKQPGVSKYDVVIDEAPDSPNQKEQVFQVLMQLIPAMVKMGMGLPLEIMDYMPLPQTLIEKMKESQQARQQQPDPEAQKAQAQLQIEQAKLQMKQQSDQVSAQLDMQKQQFEAVMRTRELEQKMALEASKAQQDMELADLKTRQEMALEELKVQHDLRLKQTETQITGVIKAQETQNQAKLDAIAQDLKNMFDAMRTSKEIELSETKAGHAMEMDKRRLNNEMKSNQSETEQ